MEGHLAIKDVLLIPKGSLPE